MLKENEQLDSLLIDDFKIIQNNSLYKFTSDSVVLSKFATPKKGDVVADFCSGSGIVGLHYYALNKNLTKSVTLFELQPQLAEMSERTIILNNLQSQFFVEQGRLQDADKSYNGKFSLILCNPPYKKANSGEQNLKREVAICRHEVEICQREIIETAHRLLKHGGRFCMCQRIERLPESFKDFSDFNLNVSRLQLVVNKASKKPYLFLIEAYKSINRQFVVLENYIN